MIAILFPMAFLPAVVAGSVASWTRKARDALCQPGLAEAVDHAFAVLGAQFAQLVQRQRHERAERVTESRQTVRHHRVRIVDPPDLAECGDQRVVGLPEPGEGLARLAGD